MGLKFSRFAFQVFSALLAGLFIVAFPRYTEAQVSREGDTRADKDYAASGQISIQIKNPDGGPFLQGAKVALLTGSISQTYSIFSDPSGQAQFTGLPVGQYLIEVTAPGYRTVQSQVVITSTRKAQNLELAMLPKMEGAKKKRDSASVSSKAVKESDKAARALELNSLNDAQLHLDRALSIDPKLADANYLMAILMLRRKEPGRAVGYLQESLKASPEHASAQLMLGEAQYLAADYTHALISLETYLTAEPNSPQAAVARKYLDSIHRVLASRAAASSTTSGTVPSTTAASFSASGAAPEPPPLDLTPDTEINWAPPDVDVEKVEFDNTDTCDLDKVIQGTSKRIQELVRNVDRFTATEQVEHFNLSLMGLTTSHESRKYNYVVEIRQLNAHDLDVHEYRSGGGAKEESLADVSTTGLPSLALVFHPALQDRYEFQCEGMGSWRSKPAWVIHFRQREGHSQGMLTYQVGRRAFSVGLRGRAWIDARTFQIVAMESDLTKTIPEIRLARDHQLIEYGPVSFRNNSMQLWLPKSADWYCSIGGHRYHQRHTFTEFLLFSVDQNQTISAPKEPVAPPPSPN